MLSIEKNSISFMVCGGFNKGMMTRSQILTTSLSSGHMTLQENLEQLTEKDDFRQNLTVPVSSELLTEDFVRKHVSDEKKQAILLDKKQPHSDLLAIHGKAGALHIFDKTHGMWLTCLSI